MFLVVLVFMFDVCLSVRPSDYLKTNEQICMTLLLEVCLEIFIRQNQNHLVSVVYTNTLQHRKG